MGSSIINTIEIITDRPYSSNISSAACLLGGSQMGDLLNISQSDNDALEAVRGFRDGQEWLLDQIRQEGGLENAPAIQPSSTPISQRAFDLIVMLEVTSQAAYERSYSRPTWPQGASGVTIGIGYDVGYVSKNLLRGDWKGAIPDAMITALESAIGVTGPDADQLAHDLGGSVDVPWSAATSVHRNKVIPKWVALTQRALPNTGDLSADSLGALVSLTYNRGASFSSQGPRYAEMRAIKGDMESKTFSDIPTQIRNMKRLWPTVKGLRIRRDLEARLFQDGLTE
jgi:GH24 family phage-related lysozyme (muramidase)